MNKETFINELKKIGVVLTEEQLKQLDIYAKELIKYNEHTNLTAIKEETEIYLKHFYDSLTLNSVIDLNQIDNMIDIGSGAGFPGVVLKIFFPHMHVTILDSNNKKTTFVAKLIEKLGLSGIEVVNARAEDYAKDKMNSFDMCVSRAVAFIDIITELSLPLIKKSGKVALMKGNFENEIVTLKKYQQKLNISNYKINKVILPNNDERNIVILEKEKETNKLLTYSQIVKRNKVWNDKK